MSAASSALEPMVPNKALHSVLDILELATGLVSVVATGKVGTVVNVADGLVAVVQKALAAYEAETGQPLDPALIRPFVPIPVPTTEALSTAGDANTPASAPAVTDAPADPSIEGAPV